MPEDQTNILRDQAWLVVPIKDAVFPRRCVKSNGAVEAANYLFEVDLLRSQIHVAKSSGERTAESVARVLFGKLGGAAVELANKKRLEYSIGLSIAKQARTKKLSRIGLVLLAVAPIVAICFGFALDAILKPGEKPPLPLVITVVTTLGILFITGIVLFMVSSMSVLRVYRSDGDHVWLEGAADSFLDSLPESPVRFERTGIFA